MNDKEALAYVVGLAIGDGNLSNPNGRAVRLRITCDSKYPKLMKNATSAIQQILPRNKVSLVIRNDRCIDISCYSNKWENWLGWQALGGSKYKQQVIIPEWIFESDNLTKLCLKGLFETDGSIYSDRGYLTVNFVNIIEPLVRQIYEAILRLGYSSNIQVLEQDGRKDKYTLRISKHALKFINDIGINKT
jgi:DNA-binding transcriptional regulator WhiA